MFKLAYNQGVQEALEKFALKVPSLSSATEHALEIGGLGLLSAYPLHGLITGPKEDRGEHLTELGGLGILSIPSIARLLNH